MNNYKLLKVKSYQDRGARCASRAQECLTLLLQNYNPYGYQEARYWQLQAQHWYTEAQLEMEKS